jgi:hypothetical protein
MRYEFIVAGTLSEPVEAELPGMSSAPYPTGGTAIFGTIQDEADAMSLLARINALGLAVVEMRQLPD